MQTIFDLILIQIIIVFIIDVSGIVPTIKHLLSRYLTKGKISSQNFPLKPLDCSLCMMHWVGLIYILFHSPSILLYAFVCILSFLTTITYELLLNIQDKLKLWVNLINKN